MASRVSQAQSEPDMTFHAHAQPLARPIRVRNRDKPEPGQVRQITHQDCGQLGPGIGQSQSSQGQSDRSQDLSAWGRSPRWR